MYFGDAIELSKTLPDNFINLVVTSPPYSSMKSYGQNVNIFHPRNYNNWFLPLAKEISRSLTPDGSFILNINDKVIGGFRDLYVFELVIRICNETNLKLYERYIWAKKNGLPTSGDRLNDRMEYIFHFTKSPKIKTRVDNVRVPYAESTIKRYKQPVAFNEVVDENGLTTIGNKKMIKENPLGTKPSTVFNFNNAGVLKGETAGKHPAPFHPDLPEFFVKFLTDPGDIVLDPFIGSGTVAEVCKKYDRNWIGFELNESYGDLINIRVNKAEQNEEFLKSELERKNKPIINEMKGSNVPDIPLEDLDENEIDWSKVPVFPIGYCSVCLNIKSECTCSSDFNTDIKENKKETTEDDPDWFDKL